MIDTKRIPAERHGDWHDKAYRFVVAGPDGEIQKFPTRLAARRYKAIRKGCSCQRDAVRQYARG